jgi:glycosyltransferase involved in cell wall biosynthesis
MTPAPPLLTLIVPIYNGALFAVQNVYEIVHTLEALEGAFEVLVVCDGCTDGTVERLACIGDPRVHVLHYEHNCGKGHAICFAASHARGRLIGWLDADLDIEPQAIVTGVSRFAYAEIDAIIGSKRHADSIVDYPLLRRVLSRGFQLLTQLLFRVNVSDTQVGAKVFRREMLDVVIPLLLIKRYAFDLELLAVGVEFGFDRIEQMPVQLHYHFSRTHINHQAVWRMFLDTLAIAHRIHLRHWYVRQFSAQQRERTYSDNLAESLASLLQPYPSRRHLAASP